MNFAVSLWPPCDERNVAELSGGQYSKTALRVQAVRANHLPKQTTHFCPSSSPTSSYLLSCNFSCLDTSISRANMKTAQNHTVPGLDLFKISAGGQIMSKDVADSFIAKARQNHISGRTTCRATSFQQRQMLLRRDGSTPRSSNAATVFGQAKPPPAFWSSR